MSDMTLFLPNELLEEKQFANRRHESCALDEAEKALVNIADDREMRLHWRLNEFTWWLFILPALIWVVGVVIPWLERSLRGTRSD